MHATWTDLHWCHCQFISSNNIILSFPFLVSYLPVNLLSSIQPFCTEFREASTSSVYLLSNIFSLDTLQVVYHYFYTDRMILSELDISLTTGIKTTTWLHWRMPYYTLIIPNKKLESRSHSTSTDTATILITWCRKQQFKMEILYNKYCLVGDAAYFL